MASRSKEIAQRADDEVIASSQLFVVNWFLGRDPSTYRTGKVIRKELWRRAEFSNLADARAAKNAAGRDEFGRMGLIYAVSLTGGITVFVDDNYERRRENCPSR